MADVTARAAVQRIAVREYLPWAGLIISWAMVLLAVGPADAARLFAASGFVRSARNLTAATVLPPVRKRVSQDGRLSRQAVRVGAKVEVLAWLAGLLALAVVLGLLLAAGQQRVVELCAIFAIGLLPLYLAPLSANREIARVFRPAAIWTGVALIGLAWLLDAGPTTFALAFAAREWIGYLICLAAAPRIRRDEPPLGPLHWREIAGYSVATGRRRLAYRLSKGALTAFLGPVGGVAARTGRGMRLHRKLDRFTPQHPLPLALLAAATSTSAVAMILAAPAPGVLVVAASLLMVAAVATNVLIWSIFLTDTPAAELAEDEEDA